LPWLFQLCYGINCNCSWIVSQSTTCFQSLFFTEQRSLTTVAPSRHVGYNSLVNKEVGEKDSARTLRTHWWRYFALFLFWYHKLSLLAFCKS
jgi:hypothetical protein